MFWLETQMYQLVDLCAKNSAQRVESQEHSIVAWLASTLLFTAMEDAQWQFNKSEFGRPNLWV